MKHINLYQQLSEEINNVSPNIHNSYMNYTLVFNLLKKQINHIHQIILDIKEDVIKKCKNINELLGETQSSRIKDKKQENLFF